MAFTWNPQSSESAVPDGFLSKGFALEKNWVLATSQVKAPAKKIQKGSNRSGFMWKVATLTSTQPNMRASNANKL